MKALASLIVAAFALPAVTAAMAQGYGSYDHHHPWGEGWGGMMMGPLLMIVVLAAVLFLVVVAARWLVGAGHTGGTPQGRAGPLDVLKDRFARGEIDREEYEERRRVLSD